MSGAGIGGLALGLAQGLKIGTDIVDSAAKRDMLAKQGKLLDLDIKEKETNNAIQQESAEVFKKLTGTDLPDPKTVNAGSQAAQPAQAPAQAQPTDGTSAQASGAGIATPQSSSAQPESGSSVPGDASVKGIATPGTEAATQKPKFDFNNLNNLAELDSQMNAIRAKHGKLDPMKAAEGMLRWTQMRNEGGIQALNEFLTTGDSEKALATFNSLGSVKLPEGTTFRREDSPIIPGSPHKAPNVIITTPDNRTLDMRSMMRSAISPKDLMAADNNLSYQASDIAIKQMTAANQAAYQNGVLKHYGNVTAETNRHNMALEKQQQENLDALMGDRLDKKILQDNNAQRLALANALAYAPKDEEQLLRLDKNGKDAYYATQNMYQIGSSIQDMNRDPKTGRFLFNYPDVVRALKTGFDKENVKLDESNQTHYVDFGGKKLYIPYTPSAQGSSASTGATGATPSRPGIKPPDMPTGLSDETKARIKANAESDAASRAAEDAKAAEARAAAIKPIQESRGKMVEDQRQVSLMTDKVINAMDPSEAKFALDSYRKYLTPYQQSLLSRRMQSKE